LIDVCKCISLAVVAHPCAKPARKTAFLPKMTEIGLERWLELDGEDWRRVLAATAKAPPALQVCSGTVTIATYRSQYRPFAKAHSIARSLELKDRGEWRIFCKSGRLPPKIPAAPDQNY